ncbi:MAG: DUF177 domain-containing protein [Eubacteriales bacterium]|nr:DUF177 domain-containing protein [Eubacteriales bacterium]
MAWLEFDLDKEKTTHLSQTYLDPEAIRCLEPEDALLNSVYNLHLEGDLVALRDGYDFVGEMSYEIELPCDRCWEPSRKRIEAPIVWHFLDPKTYSAVESRNDDYSLSSYPLQGRRLIFDEPIHDGIVFSLPQPFLCQEDCEGLSAYCDPTVTSSPFAALEGLRFEE